MKIEALEHALDEQAFGGKAVGLARSLAAGLTVPPGIAIDVEAVEALATSTAAEQVCASIIDRLGDRPLAVRSSAVGEDSDGASFAGQHLTKLNVVGATSLQWAIREVWASARTESARAYRRRLGLDELPRIGIVVQRMVAADRAGVLFTRNPLTGADERVIEASWGLGEAVVQGLITPDRWTVASDGQVVEMIPGEKDIEIVAQDDGVVERAVEEHRVFAPCLSSDDIAALHVLAARCDTHFNGASDIEWAFENSSLYLLQRRPITT